MTQRLYEYTFGQGQGGGLILRAVQGSWREAEGRMMAQTGDGLRVEPDGSWWLDGFVVYWSVARCGECGRKIAGQRMLDGAEWDDYGDAASCGPCAAPTARPSKVLSCGHVGYPCRRMVVVDEQDNMESICEYCWDNFTDA